MGLSPAKLYKALQDRRRPTRGPSKSQPTQNEAAQDPPTTVTTDLPVVSCRWPLREPRDKELPFNTEHGKARGIARACESSVVTK